MQMRPLNYLILILLHIVLAFAIFFIKPLSILYCLLIFLFGAILIVKNKNRNNEVLLVCGYIVGAEVFIRATNGAFLYEFAKYGIILFLFLGMYFSSFSKNIFPYLLYLLLLLPALFVATTDYILTDNDRKIISFTISGPVCLGVCAIYCYQRRVSIETVYSILLAIGLPIVSLTTYLILFNPVVRDVLVGTDSSGATSGGFGPNQVSTVVGLGIFIFLSRTILNSKSKIEVFINIFLTIIIAFRGIVTFSRGGILTAIIISFIFIFNIYFLVKRDIKFKIIVFVAAAFFVSSAIWGYSILQTNGLIANRYAGQDALGRSKASRFTGREELAENEIKIFYQYPIFGAGVGRSIKIRETETGIKSASHSELTRLLAEHGFLGILILLILFIAPLVLIFNNKQHLFLLPFFMFWLLTINHAAMRIAAPAFLYALALLHVKFNLDDRRL